MTEDSPWELPPTAVHPTKMLKLFSDLRIKPSELDPEILKLFVPLAHKVDQENDQHIYALGKLIAEAFTIHNGVTHILENEEWDFVGVYYGSIDHFCHAFIYFHPPQMENIDDHEYELYKDVINACYIFHDRMLGRLLQLAGDDATVIVCSDHGFHSDELRPKGIPNVPAGPAIWHRDQGIIIAKGPNIKKDQLVHGANLLDITPTILHAMDLPIARDMDGRPLLEIFENASQLKTIDSWETRKGKFKDGMHPDSAKVSEEESKAILDQFVALGYIDRPDEENMDETIKTTIRENNWNLARSYLDSGNVSEAIPVLEEIVDSAPDRLDYVMTLANCLQSYGLHDVANELVSGVLPYDPQDVAINHTLADFALASGDIEKAAEHVQIVEKELAEHPTLRGAYTAGRWLTLATTYFKLKQYGKSLEHAQKAVEADPDFARGYLSMAQSLVKLKRYEEAADVALSAVELEHHLAQGHFVLGVALGKMQQWKESYDAFVSALHYSPFYRATHRMLAIVCNRLGNTDAANLHRAQAGALLQEHRNSKGTLRAEADELAQRMKARIPKIIQAHEEAARRREENPPQKGGVKPLPPELEFSGKTFCIVSGLPRSGTSLMMQMLEKGGLPPMTDNERVADDDNPEGYYEWEAIKKVQKDPEMIERAEGKATKVISMLLPYLPQEHDYKIIFVARPIEEIVASQKKMIERRGTTGAALNEKELEESLTRHRRETIRLIRRRYDMRLLIVDYHTLLSNPEIPIKRIQAFLGPEFLPNASAMSGAIRPELYRNRGHKLKKDKSEQKQPG